MYLLAKDSSAEILFSFFYEKRYFLFIDKKNRPSLENLIFL